MFLLFPIPGRGASGCVSEFERIGGVLPLQSGPAGDLNCGVRRGGHPHTRGGRISVSGGEVGGAESWPQWVYCKKNVTGTERGMGGESVANGGTGRLEIDNAVKI